MKGKVVIFNYLHDPLHESNPVSSGIDDDSRRWNHHAFSFMVSNNYQYSSRTELLGAAGCTRDNGHPSSALLLVNHFITAPAASAAWASAANYYSDLRGHAEKCQTEYNKVPNFLLVDFWSIGDVIAVALELNKDINPSSYPEIPASSYITGDGGAGAVKVVNDGVTRYAGYVPVNSNGGGFTCQASSLADVWQPGPTALLTNCGAVWTTNCTSCADTGLCVFDSEAVLCTG